MSDSNKNLIIVSNRLPVSVSKVDGKLVYSQSSGGLATGLSSVAKAKDSLWIGWPGISLEETTKNERLQITRELKKRGCNPVFLSKDQIENYYSGYSNGTLWPLFHYTHDKVENIPIQWEAYKEVNQLFCDTVTKQINGSSTVWVHDYHLMKLPALLREQKPATKIGFFLHTPFPSYEIFRLLPERIEVIEGLMGADLIGFHTYDYVRHFNSTILRLLGYEESAGKILAGDRQISVEVYPIGIDYQKFSTYKPKPGKSDIGSMKQFGSGMKTLLSFDRADYSKGIPERLAAFEHFLNKYPEYHKKVVLLVIVAPSRVDVEAYQNLQEEIDIKISHINGTYSTVDWAPISYIYRDLDFDEVVRAYKGSDVMLVTPLRDGMNLMAKEFIATKQNGNGVLILSELAGAASEMLEAVLVNPADKDMVAEAIYKALKMPASEQASRLNRLHERIAKYTVQKWAKDFVSDLKLLSLEQAEATPKHLSKKDKKIILKQYSQATKRLILLDYDGTLTKFVDSPDPHKAKPSRRIIDLLGRLSKVKNNKVVIISGRPKRALANWFKNISVMLVAEHGGWIKRIKSWVKTRSPNDDWKKSLKPILESYVDRTPGAILETKDFALVWHYRNVNPDLAYVRRQELAKEIEMALNDFAKEIGVFFGNKIIELKPKYLGKGETARRLTTEDKYDFVLAMGDDYTDEEMFEALPEEAISIKVGIDSSMAKYHVDNVDEAQQLIHDLGNSTT